MRRALHEENRLSWNEATRAHNRHKGDQAAFLRGGGSTLFPEEIELLGDVRGKRLVHLQCNAGQDTLSLAKHLGAEVLGVDISDEAIDFAQRLSAESGIPGRFVRSDVYDFLGRTEERFDVTFASYGAICWLSDLEAWARGVERILTPGGRLVLVEFHTAAQMFDEKGVRRYPFSTFGKPWTWDAGVSDYVAASGEGLTPQGAQAAAATFENPHRCHEFIWGLGELVSAVAGSGLRVELLREWPWSNGFRFLDDMEMREGRRWYPTGPAMPVMYGLTAAKPG